ncbi:hypothetical protein K503DRAFT_723070 [Rhizopogon vinicolor AM-OR11-026]|uniref:Uncharacterized protein n=1 Tax=Rhizopogon vinicolor AM-OR11-026 TaxID=1314800 RepID=A0A1B7MS14_9AGAM|nr:hypothetical protein K503DRAFT_723070 [Rhizopogon vinicolor AM-OR11-026]
MTLLGGIFAKRDKQNRARTAPANLNVPATPTSVASISSTVVSSEPDYVNVFPDKTSSPPDTIYSGPAAASSSKLKLPFRRKHVHQPHAAGTPRGVGVVSLNDGHRISGVVSESGHDIPPPPPKSSIFAMYHDQNANSAHSLLNESESTLPCFLSDTPSKVSTASPSTQPSPPLNKKSGGIFSWARERTKSKPSPPPATITALPTPSPAPGDNFNLKAFRHVRPESLALPDHRLDADLPPPPARPRPRGDSVASDSSQRISVAAFREAQARRSCTNSPVPSFRPPSIDTLRVENNSRKRASTVSTPTVNDFPPHTHRSSTTPQLSIRTSRYSSALDTSESDESEDDDDEEVDSDGEPINPSRKSTVTRRSTMRSRSGAGHTVPDVQTQRPDPPRWSQSDNAQLRQPDSVTAVRMRASASTSALTPNAAARRASILASANASSAALASERPLSSRTAKNDDSDTSDSSNSDSEDMPLSALVAPRRPGSSASVSTAGSRPRMPAKPLIDIKSLVGSPPVLKPVLRHEHSVKVPSNKGKEREVNKDEPFAPPPVISLTPSHLMESANSVTAYSATVSNPKPPLTRHKKSSSDIGCVPRQSSEPLPDVDDDLMTAIKLVTSFDKVRETSPSPTQPSQKVTPPNPAPPPAVERLADANDRDESPRDDRIVPTPVREYKPPAAFSVTSRPPRPYSVDISQLSSPTSPTATFSSATKRSSSPKGSPPPMKSSFAPRSRAATLAQQPDMPSNDRSDSSSAISTSQSSHSSRVPRVPLINAVPESPSVKASWGTSKNLYKARAPSASSLADSRMSRPPPNAHVSLVPPVPRMHVSATAPQSQSQSQMLTPSRPFASNTNSSLRGQSPAGSSTGDSSSGAPFTPRDGSDLGVNTGRRDGNDADSTLKARGKNARRSTVSFEDDPPRGREKVKNDAADEERRNERRRNEAKAAIELGKIVNGRGPIVHSGSDDDLVPRPGQLMSINPMMGADGAISGMNAAAWAPWQQQQQLMANMGPMVPQFNSDPSFFAAHQHAMMIAKQAYQMAVARHAMAIAGDEWERSSNAGGGSVYGGGGGSVYSGMGGGGGMGMLNVPGMGMPTMMPNQWPTGSVSFPGRIGSSQSEFGGGSRSVYGESFGPSMSSRSGHVPATYGVPSSSTSAYGGHARPRAKTGASQPSNLQTQVQTPGRIQTPARKVAPPSSWKNAR